MFRIAIASAVPRMCVAASSSGAVIIEPEPTAHASDVAPIEVQLRRIGCYKIDLASGLQQMVGPAD